ncbi:MAG: flippase [Candidatus Parcubacteria bacterium]|nr:flippase [Candidatus Parcubacteria bacterium]
MIQFVGKVLGTLFGVLTVAIMTRYLGQVGFGQYSTITAYLQLFAILVDLGLSITVVRLIADPGNDQPTVFNNLFTLRIVTSLIFLGLAPLIVIFFPYDNLVKIGIAVATLSFFFSALTQVLIGLYQKELNMLTVTIGEIAGRMVLFCLVALFAYLNYGLLAIVVAVVIGSLINFLICYFSAFKYIKISPAFDWPIWKKIIGITWPIALSIAFNLVYFKADTLILSLTRSQAEVGLYSAPYRILEILVNFIFVFLGIVNPILTLYWVQKNYAKFQEIFQKIFDVLLIITIPMVVGTMFIAKPLMILIAGADFSASGIILQILIVATAIIFINTIYGYTIIFIDKQKKMIPVYLFVAIFAVIGYLLTIPAYGFFGAAIFTVISEFIILISNFVISTKVIKFVPSFKITLKILGACLVMSGLLYLLSGQNVILQLILASAVYLIALYFFKGIDKMLIVEILRLRGKSE